MGLTNTINYNYLKNKIGEENIFRHYFGTFSFHRNYNSKLRDDPKKSVSFFRNSKSGKITYKDFGREVSYNCVEYVMQLYLISYAEALKRIAKDFGLNGDVAVAKIYKTKPIEEKEKCIFSVYKRNFTQKDLDWWAEYSISKQELIDNNICSVSKIIIGNNINYTTNNDVRFAYLFTDENDSNLKYFKIYTPTNNNFKWLFNGPLNLVFGIEKLIPNKKENLIITKSVKDYIILKKFYNNVIALQNESKASIKPETINVLKKLYKNVYVWFDSDRPGIVAANYYKKTFGLIPIFIGEKSKNIWNNLKMVKEKGIKDPSDFVKVYNLDNFEKWLQLNNFI